MVRSSIVLSAIASTASLSTAYGYAPARLHMTVSSSSSSSSSRRGFVSKSIAFALGTTTASLASIDSRINNLSTGGVANAVGPVKIDLVNPTYTAAPCPKDKPIPGEKAMKGMRGLCVQVKAELAENSPKDLDKVGVYGYVADATSSESVLANNPDAGTDAGQFAMIPSISTTDKKIEFEFIAAIPMEDDLSKYEAGIGPLNFKSLRVISFPGGQQYGAISPCEMNEFSEECEAWEEENGPYEKADFMVKSNKRTKGR
ncbi:hypothetical protein ACHAXR_003582 [Thalassiosira sp. AJA248-18]